MKAQDVIAGKFILLSDTPYLVELAETCGPTANSMVCLHLRNLVNGSICFVYLSSADDVQAPEIVI